MNEIVTFTDLCGGIGGTRQAIENGVMAEHKEPHCILYADPDKFCQKTYIANFGNEEPILDWLEDISDLPPHTILSAGFPCQPFSLAGVSKKRSLGRKTGFEDKISGTVFFELARLIDASKPRVVFLENVKNLASHDRGKTLATILDVLRNDLGYHVIEPKVFDARLLVPQHRERIFIIGFRNNKDYKNFEWPVIEDTKPRLASILEPQVDSKYTLSNKLWLALQRHAERSRQKGSGFGFGLADINGVSRTLSARYYKDGAEILIPQTGQNKTRDGLLQESAQGSKDFQSLLR